MNEQNKPTVSNPVKAVVMWQDECKPDKKGWYAVNYCWCVRDGSFCGADYFDGEKWREALPVNQFAGVFESKSLAMSWVDHNDISF